MSDFPSPIVEAEFVLNRLLRYAKLETYSVPREELADRLEHLLPHVILDGKPYVDFRPLRIASNKWKKILLLSKNTSWPVIVHVHRQKDNQQHHEIKIHPAGFDLPLGLTSDLGILARVLPATVDDNVLTIRLDGNPNQDTKNTSESS